MRKADTAAAAGKGGNEPAQPAKAKPQLKHVGGSKSDDWNTTLANQAMQAVWRPLKPRGTRQAVERHPCGAGRDRAEGRAGGHDRGAAHRVPQRRYGVLPPGYDRRTEF